MKFVSEKVGGYHTVRGVKVWGYDLVEPKEKYSVSQYIKDARNIIKHIKSGGKLPILVGGTGFYIKGVVDGIETANIPRNSRLRESLVKFSIEDLFEKLANISAEKAASMNISDKKNPRRVIRAIEVAQWKMTNSDEVKNKNLKADTLFVGIKMNKKKLEEKIKKRIARRIEEGLEKEIENLLLSGIGWDTQSMQALGYKQWEPYLKGYVSRKKVIDDWFNAEKKYAKKQMIWFKKDPRIRWFEQSNANWREVMLQLVSDWINKDVNKKD